MINLNLKAILQLQKYCINATFCSLDFLTLQYLRGRPLKTSWPEGVWGIKDFEIITAFGIKKRGDGGGGVKNYHILRDIIYERPLSLD